MPAMNSLSENYKWLFDGVGGAAVIAAIGYIVHRFLRSPNRGDAVLTAEGSNVNSSPVASGSGINQTINSPTTINVSTGAATPETPLRFFSFDGTSGPLCFSGKQHSAQDPSLVDLSCLVTIVNYRQFPMKIWPTRLLLDGAEWPFESIFFREKSNPQYKLERISVEGNRKEHYELHSRFPATACPQARSGHIVMETDTAGALQVEVTFP